MLTLRKCQCLPKAERQKVCHDEFERQKVALSRPTVSLFCFFCWTLIGKLKICHLVWNKTLQFLNKNETLFGRISLEIIKILLLIYRLCNSKSTRLCLFLNINWLKISVGSRDTKNTRNFVNNHFRFLKLTQIAIGRGSVAFILNS